MSPSTNAIGTATISSACSSSIVRRGTRDGRGDRDRREREQPQDQREAPVAGRLTA